MSFTVADTIFVDRQLVLRQLQMTDAPALFKLIDQNREYLSKWLQWVGEVQTIADSERTIRVHLQWRQKQEAFSYGIFLNAQLIGLVTLCNVSNGLVPEIGYWMSQVQAGKGFMTRAALAISKLGFERLKLAQIVIKADPENIASNRVAKKTGFLYTGQEIGDYNSIVNVWTLTRPIRL